MKKAALYCRISVEDKSNCESESIKNQKILLQKYAKDNGFEIYKIYCDEDYSGLDNERPQFKQMIEDSNKKLFDTIICKNQSRFTRDISTADKYLNVIFPQMGIRFIGIVDNIDTSVKNGKRIRQINSLVNEWYCEEISENIRSVFKRKMETGLFIGTYAPYGYIKNPKYKHKLEIDKNTEENIKLIFKLFKEGKNCREIAEILTEMKIPTPSQYKISKGMDMGRKNIKNKGVWSKNTIRKILTNPVYMGDMVQGKERKISYKSNKVSSVSKEEWIWVKNTHEPIISKEDFLSVQNMFNK